MAEPQEIQQLPFQPLVPQQQFQPAQQFQPPLMDTGEGINPRLFGAPGANDIDRIALMNRNVENLDTQQSSFLPNALAIGALLSGNFGPMMQLQEQKRKTELARVMGPSIMEATKLSHQGKFDEAMDLMTNATNAAGARAPELATAYREFGKKIADDQAKWQDVKSWSWYLDRAVPDTAHPDMVNFRDFMHQAVKDRTLVSKELLGMLAQKAMPHTQIINDQLQQVGNFSGQLTNQPLPNVFTPKEVGGPIGEMAASKLGITVPIMTDILNLRPGMAPIRLPDGTLIEPDSPGYQAVVQAYQSTLPARAAIGIGEKIPMEPAVATALGYVGATPFEIATRTYSQAKLQEAVIGDQARKVQVSAAAALAAIRQDPLIAQRLGMTIVNGSTSLPVRTPMDLDTAEKSKDKLLFIPNDVYTTKYQPSLEALGALKNLEPFIANLGNPQTFGERLASGVNRWVSDKIGVAVAPGIEVSKVFEDILNKAIEEAVTRSGIAANDVEVGRIKRLTTGAGANPAAARKAVDEIERRLRERIQTHTGEEALRSGATPSAGAAALPGAIPPTGAVPNKAADAAAAAQAAREAQPTIEQRRRGQPYQLQSPTSSGTSKKGTVVPYQEPGTPGEQFIPPASAAPSAAPTPPRRYTVTPPGK